MSDTPETIYLIPGEDGLVWCDDPEPDEHCDPEESVKYVRADVAELERLRELANRIRDIAVEAPASNNMQLIYRLACKQAERAGGA